MSTVPYENATSGAAARDEITKILRRFGCSSIGFMDDFDEHAVTLYFVHRDNQVRLRASADGWAAMFLREHPWNSRMKSTQKQHQQKAVDQGIVAINSILRDWVKGQVTAVETGVLSFGAVFLPYMLANDGRPLIEHVREAKLLPAPEAE